MLSLLAIILCQIRTIETAYIRGRYHSYIEIENTVNGSPRALNYGRMPNVVKLSGGIIPGGNDPDGKELINFENPGSADGPFPFDTKEKKKIFDNELKIMYPHMVTHAIQKEVEDWEDGADIAKKGGMAPGGKIDAPPPFPKKNEGSDEKPPPPPKGGNSPSANPFIKNTPKEVKPEDMAKVPGKDPEEEEKKQEKKEEKKKEEEEAVNEIVENAKEEAEDKEKEEYEKAASELNEPDIDTPKEDAKDEVADPECQKRAQKGTIESTAKVHRKTEREV